MKPSHFSCARLGAMLLVCAALSLAQEITLTARIAMMGHKTSGRHNAGNVVVWLTPVSGGAAPAPMQLAPPLQLVQKNKTFEPHVLVVPVGAVVAFPNHDPFFHNVFSLFEGKRFDLGLYDAGSTRDVHFDKPGVSYIFCNIHPEMSAVVLALETPYYGISNARGEAVIGTVPAGDYTLRVWYENALPETLQALTRQIRVSDRSSTLGVLLLPEAPSSMVHKNLYGREYDPPTPNSPAYER